MKIGIVGAGHAGVAAAQEAAKYGAEVTLFSKEGFLPYYRPRIASVAFLQSGENDIFIHPEGWYLDNKIKLVLETKVVQVNTNEISLASEHSEYYRFDKIIIATGAKPIVPPFAEALILQGKVSPLWTIQDALTIRKKISSIRNIVVVGGGVIGIESALRALDAGLNVSIIEKAPSLMIRNLSPKASYTLSNILKAKGIKLIMNEAIEEVHEKNNGVEIETSSGGKIYAELVLLSIGGAPNTKIAGLPKLDMERGLEVDFQTKTQLPNLFAAGDAAIFKNIQPYCSALKANGQGKVAGGNAVKNDNFAEYKPSAIAVELKFKDFELHSIGFTKEENNKKEEVIEESATTYRSVVKRNDDILGIQMVGSGKDFITYKKQLKEEF